MTKILTIRPYVQEDALKLLTDHKEKAWAKINEAYGPGITYELDGEVVACAGVRTFGMGEIWACFNGKAKELKFTLCKESKKQIMQMMEMNQLWMIIATVDEKCTPQQREFIEFLGFEKVECYVYRKE